MIWDRVKICCDGGVMRNIQGFTLIELMVTIAVLAIIVTIAAPSFITTIRKTQLNGDTRAFVNLLTETRSEAIFKQIDKKLTLDGSGGFRNWQNTEHVKKSSGESETGFSRMGQSTEDDSNKRCFVFEHKSDETLKTYVYIQKAGTVLYDKTATACPNETDS